MNKEKKSNKEKEAIREKFGRKCYLCGKPEKDNGGRRLLVRYVEEYDIHVPICASCNGLINCYADTWNRDMYTLLKKIRRDFVQK